MEPEPFQYLLGYFHQDWTDDYDSWEELIDDFVANDRQVAERTPAALRALLEENSESALAEKCDDMHVAWDFARMGGSYTNWFQMLLERIESQLARS